MGGDGVADYVLVDPYPPRGGVGVEDREKIGVGGELASAEHDAVGGLVGVDYCIGCVECVEEGGSGEAFHTVGGEDDVCR